jgi:hypothetical protein
MRGTDRGQKARLMWLAEHRAGHLHSVILIAAWPMLPGRRAPRRPESIRSVAPLRLIKCNQTMSASSCSGMAERGRAEVNSLKSMH